MLQIIQPQEYTFDIDNEIDEHNNPLPQDSPWYIEDMPDASQIYEPNSMVQGRGRYECNRFKLND